MQLDPKEEELLRSVTLQNARAVLAAREKAEWETVAAKEALGRSNQQITSILERISDGFAALDQEWRFTYLNRKGAEIFQRLKRGERTLLGKSLWEEFPELKGTEIEQYYLRAAREQVTVEFETHLERLKAWYIVRIYPSGDGYSIYLLDISRRKNTEAQRIQAEDALRASEQHFRAAFNQAAVGMAVASMGGKFEEVNDRFVEILGYSREELLQLGFAELTHPDDLQNTRENVRRLLAGEIEHFVYEKRFLRKDGGEVWALTSVTLLLDSTGKPNKFIGVIDDISERKRSEERLRDGTERLQLALSAGQLGDWSWDVKSDVVTFGMATAEIFGLPGVSSITWAEMRERLHPEDRERARMAVEKAIATRADYDIEYRIQHSSGYHWVAARGRGIYASDGTVRGMNGVVQDISDRKGNEEIRSRLAAVVASSDDAIISLALDGLITTWNKGAEKMFGYTAVEMIGESIQKLLPTDRQDEEGPILRRLVAGERVEHYETVRIRKDGTHLQVSLSVSPVHDANGRLVGVSKISRDITERKKAEAALMEEAQTREILNDTGKAIASQLDLQTVVQIVTDSATRLSGAQFGAFFYNVIRADGEAYTLYTVSGAPREAFDKFGHPRATPLFGPTFRGEGIVRIGDVKKDPRYGKWGPHHGIPKNHPPVSSYLAVPVISRDGTVIGGLFFAHAEPDVFTERAERLVAGVAAQAAVAIDNARLYDAAQHEITERKKIEEELRGAQEKLRSHAEDLEEVVAERTARLRETIGELEAFSYSVSHDMRSPLRAMQGYSDALLDDYGGKLDESAQDYLNRIKRAASRMDLLIQDVLAYSRVAQGDVPLKVVDLNNMISDVIQTYPNLQPENAAISVAGKLPSVIGHEAYLTQAVSNILTNGVKFVAPGTFPCVKVGAVEEGGMVRLFFQDNGIGIAAEHRDRIFQIFGRVYSDKQYEGTGIGLAIAKKATERMGGSIGVTSEVGKGSCFSLLLKAANDNQ